MRLTLVLACLFLAPLAAPFGAQEQMTDAPRISQKDFKKLIASKAVVIVDTRNAESFEQGHIPGAVLLPLEGQWTWPESYQPTVNKLKASKVMVVAYCA